MTLHFAVKALRHGALVAVVDADKQQSSAKWALRRDESLVVKAQPAGDTPIAQILTLCREDSAATSSSTPCHAWKTRHSKWPSSPTMQ
jgi:hypothetical protein